MENFYFMMYNIFLILFAVSIVIKNQEKKLLTLDILAQVLFIQLKSLLPLYPSKHIYANCIEVWGRLKATLSNFQRAYLSYFCYVNTF